MLADSELIYIDALQSAFMPDIVKFLMQQGLKCDPGISEFIVLRRNNTILACGGLDNDIIKCVAISPALRGTGILLRLITELTYLGFSHGHHVLSVYTKAENEALFRHCGFTPLVRIPGSMVFMENSCTRLANYTAKLAACRKPGNIIGAIVLNANPCTLGHLHLIRYAAAHCDWLHLFLVKEDRFQFSYTDRLRLVQEATGDIPHLTVHPGSQYVISRATFPDYFLKDAATARHCHCAIDITLFRQHLAPVLGITHRFVGSEPFCQVTAEYNRLMRHWLSTPDQPWPVIELVEIPRLTHGGSAISASRVRALLREGDIAAIAPLVPQTTLTCIQALRTGASESALIKK